MKRVAVAAALSGLPVRPVFNAHHASGQATSVATGIGALAADVSDVDDRAWRHALAHWRHD